MLNDNPKFITHPHKIISILQAIHIQDCLCTLWLPGQKKKFLASIIEINLEQNLLVLGEINSMEANKTLPANHKVKLSTTYLNGVHLAFSLTLTAQQNAHTNTVNYTAPFPERIYYPQRRNSPRLPTDTLTIRWHKAHKQFSEQHEVIDISRGGIAIRLSTTNSTVQPHDILRQCHLTLPNGYEAVFNLIVSSTKTKHKKIIIGGYFANLSPQCQKKLESYIAALEREVIRKRKNTRQNL